MATRLPLQCISHRSALLLTLTLAACGGSGKSASLPTATASASASATTTRSATASASPTVTTTPSAAATSTATPAATSTSSPSPTASPTLTLTPLPSPSATPDLRLRALADGAGVYVGAAFVEGSEDPLFREVLGREFNSTTAPLYWSSTEPQPGTFNFAIADQALDAAQATGLRVRGHPLVWGRLALPTYVQQSTDAAALRTLMTEHIQAIMARYRGRIAQYDVVNEPLTFDGGGGRADGLEPYVFLRLLGPEYIRQALDIAHAADPDARLFINDFFVERPGQKQDRFFALVQGLVQSGAPLHGVGLQGHITPPFGPAYRPTRDEIIAAVQRFAALGLSVEVTELDVSLLSNPAGRLDEQAATYADVVTGCFTTPGCSGVTTWAISDKYTWIRNSFGVDAWPLLFDTAFQPKPAYFAVRDVLRDLPRKP